MTRATFTLSLDLELGWGSWSSGKFSDETYAGGSRYARQIDDLSRDLDLPFTWAIVGALFDLSIGELSGVPPALSVGALRPMLGPYRQPLPTVGRVLAAPEAFLDRPLVQRLAESPAGHELGTHTYFHACPSTAAGLQTDVEACRRAMTQHETRTIVFPRDAVQHVEVLPAAGVDQYRDRPEAPYYSEGRSAAMARVRHTLDQALGRPARMAKARPGAVTAYSSSAVLTLRYGARRHIPLRALRRRFLQPLDDAVRRGGIYHLWTHPWNLAIPGSDGFGLLSEVCHRAAQLRDRGDLDVLTMRDVCRRRAT
jgi:hypothetical protein